MNIKEILIINQPVGNRGDESAHRALVHSLNKAIPSAHITILSFMDWSDGISEFIVDSPQNEYIKFLYSHNWGAEPYSKYLIKHGLTGIGTYTHPVLRRLLPFYKKADIVICAPGGICMGGFQNWKHMYLLQVARLLHKPIIYYSRSIGPFPTNTPQSTAFKRLSVEMLKGFDFLSLRDRKSKQIATELGTSFVSSIDSAFLEQPRCNIPPEIKEQLQNNYVIFVPNQLTWHYAYHGISQRIIDDFYIKTIDLICQEYPRHQIVMLPQLCSVPSKNSDYTYFKKIQDIANDKNILVIPDSYGSDIQQTIISNAKLVVGARYHSIVFAINNEIPFLALSYEHKVSGLLEDLYLQDQEVNITKTFSSESNILQTLSLLSSKLKKAKQTHPKRTHANEIACECFNKLIQYIKAS